MSFACGSAIGEAQRPAARDDADFAMYRTQLFNLLGDKGVIGKKNLDKEAFSRRFDALLASSSLATADKTPVSLRKRLLSGPAPEPEVVAEPGSGTRWILYAACQAHACDETSLRLLFDPVSRKMVGKLSLRKQTELLGAPDAGQRRLLESP